MSNQYADRSHVVKIIFIVIGALFVGRLAMLQLFNPEYKEKGKQQSLRDITQYPARGFIYDRHGELLEHARYVAHSYGTPKAFVEKQMAAGFNVILDIEVQGARQVKERSPEAVLIFILPPSMEELRRRLENRGTDSAEVIDARLRRAREELKEASIYDYIIVNDKLDEAAAEFAAILKAEHCRYTHRRHLLETF